MKTLKQILLFTSLIVLFNCEVAPVPIEYGTDSCHFCRMTIVDKVHAAEVVTKKGKVYKFDAIECMINFDRNFEKDKIALYLCNELNNSEALINAREATFLISENIPSPMGAFLSAFADKAEAKRIQNEKGGELYDWNELITRFNQ
ncbi:MAG: hypothetical protein HKO67_06575 [Flavobacteriaceae bacterium]|nr:hypothetical protein [Flavobacteriaceae bacterium]NNL80133.1 hypothetical protein [Flavobacteriaceae bacterium]